MIQKIKTELVAFLTHLTPIMLGGTLLYALLVITFIPGGWVITKSMVYGALILFVIVQLGEAFHPGFTEIIIKAIPESPGECHYNPEKIEHVLLIIVFMMPLFWMVLLSILFIT